VGFLCLFAINFQLSHYKFIYIFSTIYGCITFHNASGLFRLLTLLREYQPAAPFVAIVAHTEKWLYDEGGREGLQIFKMRFTGAHKLPRAAKTIDSPL